MQISKATQELLASFTLINPSILIKTGNSISTMSPAKNILAKADINEEFDHEVCIYDLGQFLGITKQDIFEGAEYNFNETSVKIVKDGNAVTYNYAAPNTIILPPDKLPQMPDADVIVELEEATLKNVINMANVLGKDDISINSDGQTVNISVTDKSDTSSNVFDSNLATGDGSVYSMYFKKESLKILPGTYTVKLSKQFISHFEHEDGDLEYWIALEQDSEYDSGE